MHAAVFLRSLIGQLVQWWHTHNQAAGVHESHLVIFRKINIQNLEFLKLILKVCHNNFIVIYFKVCTQQLHNKTILYKWLP